MYRPAVSDDRIIFTTCKNAKWLDLAGLCKYIRIIITLRTLIPTMAKRTVVYSTL